LKLLEHVEFLRVRLCGREYHYDIVVLPGCVVEPRWAKRLSKKYAELYQHTPLSREELEEYLARAGDIDCLVVGTGLEGRMRLTPEAQRLVDELRRRGVRVYVAKTRELLGLELEGCKRILAVVHVTC